MAAGSLGLAETYAALHDAVVGIEVGIDVVSVSGPDAMSYLQGQVSQDLGPLAPGDSAETLLLSPQGKLDGYGRVVRVADAEACLVVDAGQGEAVLARLARFKVRVRADLGLVHERAVLLRGPAARPAASAATAPIVLAVDDPGFAGCDLVGTAVTWPADVPVGDPAAFEAARIESGRPVMGQDLSEKTIPQEAGLVERAVSLTKGCYTGQELVARLDARHGRVARRLVGFVIAPGDAAAGDEVVIGGRTVGSVTSVAYSPRTASPVALGYLHRDVVVPATVEVVNGDAVSTATAAELPLWRG